MNDLSVKPQFHYDPFSQDARRDPRAFYSVLREHHPAYFIPEYDTYVFSRYADVWDGFMDAEHFSEAEGQLFSREALLVHHRGSPPQPKLDEPKAMFLFTDPPVHSQFRRPMAPLFAKGTVARLAPQITELTRERIAHVREMGSFDLNGDFASFVSVGAVMLLMGLPQADKGRIISLVNLMVKRQEDRAGPSPEGGPAREELMGFLTDAVAARRAGRGPESQLIDILLGLDALGRPLTDEEIAVDLSSILIGGTETVPKIVCDGLLQLQQRPDQLAEVRADLATNSVVAFEEMLRFSAPAQWFGRTVKKARMLGGVSLEVGQRVILLLASANRDPREFDNPDEFIWNRKARRMLSFGVGPHFCIGIHLARLEGQIMLRELLAAFPDYRVEPEKGRWPVSEFQIGWTCLPMHVGAAA